jgi:hypothetical protein
MLRPRPVPLPTALVVKNGSNARCSTSGAMPRAGVADRHHTYSPVHIGIVRGESSSISTFGGFDGDAPALRHGIAGIDRRG